MLREEMLSYLAALDLNSRLPIYVISYGRAGTAPLLNNATKWTRQDDVNVVVRVSQAAEYRAAYPTFNIRPLPDDMIPSCGAARWGALDLALLTDGEEEAILMDDDVLHTRFLFQREFFTGKNAGLECSGHNTLEDTSILPDTEERVVAAMGQVGREVFAAHPNAVLGSMIKQHMSFSYKNHRTKYVLNGGATPRQAMVWHPGRLADHGVRLDLEKFGVHGEDIGAIAAILAAGLDCFSMPSFVLDHWPEAVNINRSSIRNAETAARFHAEELEALMEYPIRDYLRQKRSKIDGSYEWGDVNWAALHRIRGTEALWVPWHEDQPSQGPAENLLL